MNNMTFDIQDANYAHMKSFIERNPWTFTENTEGDTKRIDLQNGKFKCCIKVYRKQYGNMGDVAGLFGL